MIGLRRKITIVKGNDKDFTVKVTKNGNPINLTDIEIYCEVKDKPNGQLLFTGIVTKTDPEHGIFTVRFPRTATQHLTPNQLVYFDFRFVFTDGSEKNFPTPPIVCNVVDRVTD